jgi:ribonuclease HII
MIVAASVSVANVVFDILLRDRMMDACVQVKTGRRRERRKVHSTYVTDKHVINILLEMTLLQTPVLHRNSLINA